MFSTIIVGTDGSATANVAVERAGELAKACGARLHVVHGCGDVTVAGDGMLAVPMVMTDEALRGFQAELEELAEGIRSSGVTVDTHVLTMSGPEALLTTAEEHDADLIVVGNQGMSGKRRFILGSVPNAVSHHAPCSVLIVHTD